MRTVALRFADNFAPSEGTIAAHEAVISNKGYVWFGKIGSALSEETIKMILMNQPAKVLLIHSGTTKRYWALVDAITKSFPGDGEFPSYYSDKSSLIKTWFRVIQFIDAPKDILSKCYVISSGELLSNVSRKSLSPFYRIECEEP